MKLKLLLVPLSLLIPISLLAQPGDPIRTDIDSACYKVITVAGRPDFITADGNYAWVIDDNNGLIKKISVDDNETVAGGKRIPGACAAPEWLPPATDSPLIDRCLFDQAVVVIDRRA